MGIDHAGKRHVALLPLRRFAQEVFILTEQNAA
jgi:hypothetical protein